MLKITFFEILDWSEVWALIIPLLCLLYVGKILPFLKPVVLYLSFAILINLSCDMIANFKYQFHFPIWLQSNNPLYNIHSLIRLICFSYFFLALKQPFFNRVRKILLVISVLFITINFSFFEDFFYPGSLSGNLLTFEAYVLLVYCMLYYLSVLKEETDRIQTGPEFFVVTGLAIYVVINFFIFLFYEPIITESPQLAAYVWNVHNLAYIIFCLFITKAIYDTSATKYIS